MSLVLQRFMVQNGVARNYARRMARKTLLVSFARHRPLTTSKLRPSAGLTNLHPKGFQDGLIQAMKKTVSVAGVAKGPQEGCRPRMLSFNLGGCLAVMQV